MLIKKFSAEFPIETKSESNVREHFAKKARRAKLQRNQTHMNCRATFGLSMKTEGIVVKLIRLATHKLDSDNLATSFKAVRDGIADYLGIDDGDERIAWEYEQEKRTSKLNTIKVEIYYLSLKPAALKKYDFFS